ncbi:MAG: Hsp70 family protein [Betaproteobacteria bacterium]
MPQSSFARACGIDFGTSNSTVGCLRPGQPTLFRLEDDKVTLPSVVFFNAEENSTHFGRAGLADYLAGYEGRLMRSLKSLLGSSLIDGSTEVHGRVLLFRELLGQFIGDLKQRADRQGGKIFEHAVIGRPVFFVDDDPLADQLAEDTLAGIARDVGFKEVSFQFEPIAAAFHYETEIEREELVLVVDIGGGTSDFSLVRLSPQRRTKSDRQDDLLATGGVHIGGTDFDRQLSLSSVMPLLGFRSLLNSGREMPSGIFFNLATWHTINFAYTRQALIEQKQLAVESSTPEKNARLLALIDQRAGHWLANAVEQAKIDLSGQDSTWLDIDRLGSESSHLLTRSEFELASASLVDRVEATVVALLRDAGIMAANVDTVFFTGGSSGIPRLRQHIAALLPQARSVEGDLFGSIGSGLAVEAARRYG